MTRCQGQKQGTNLMIHSIAVQRPSEIIINRNSFSICKYFRSLVLFLYRHILIYYRCVYVKDNAAINSVLLTRLYILHCTVPAFWNTAPTFPLMVCCKVLPTFLMCYKLLLPFLMCYKPLPLLLIGCHKSPSYEVSLAPPSFLHMRLAGMKSHNASWLRNWKLRVC